MPSRANRTPGAAQEVITVGRSVFPNAAAPPDDEAGTSRPSCLHAGDRVLRHPRLSGFETEGPSTRQKVPRSGLPTSATRPF
jgi:hypothetical protein